MIIDNGPQVLLSYCFVEVERYNFVAIHLDHSLIESSL